MGCFLAWGAMFLCPQGEGGIGIVGEACACILKMLRFQCTIQSVRRQKAFVRKIFLPQQVCVRHDQHNVGSRLGHTCGGS